MKERKIYIYIKLIRIAKEDWLREKGKQETRAKMLLSWEFMKTNIK